MTGIDDRKGINAALRKGGMTDEVAIKKAGDDFITMRQGIGRAAPASVDDALKTTLDKHLAHLSANKRAEAREEFDVASGRKKPSLLQRLQNGVKWILTNPWFWWIIAWLIVLNSGKSIETKMMLGILLLVFGLILLFTEWRNEKGAGKVVAGVMMTAVLIFGLGIGGNSISESETTQVAPTVMVINNLVSDDELSKPDPTPTPTLKSLPTVQPGG